MLRITEIAENEIVITEHYAVEYQRTGRGVFAEVKDAGSRYNGLYGFGSTKEGALACLAAKISQMPSDE
jgi:hypothetical protein